MKQTRTGACSQDPQDWAFSSQELSVQPGYSHWDTCTMESEKQKSQQHRGRGGGEEKAKLYNSRNIYRRETVNPKASFPPPHTAMEKGEGRKLRFPGWPAEWQVLVPTSSSTNKHSELPGQTCFSARFQSSASERERKQEGCGVGARKRDGCRRDRRGMRNLGQIRWESAQPLTRN